MSNNLEPNSNVRFVTLPPMRVVYNTAVGTSPEDEATAPAIEWLESSGLMGTARLFGGNVNPLPGKAEPDTAMVCAHLYLKGSRFLHI